MFPKKNVDINWLLGRSCHLCSVWCATHLTQQSCVFIYVKRTICLVYCVTRYTHSHQHRANTKSVARCYIDITSNWVNHFCVIFTPNRLFDSIFFSFFEAIYSFCLCWWWNKYCFALIFYSNEIKVACFYKHVIQSHKLMVIRIIFQNININIKHWNIES